MRSAFAGETTIPDEAAPAADGLQRSAGLALWACDCIVDVQCSNDDAAALLSAGFAALASAGGTSTRAYGADCRERDISHPMPDGRTGAIPSEDCERLLFRVDRTVIMALQRRRPDLFFLHAAAVARNGRVAVLAAPAGTGKSTLTLSLLQQGFEYLSDELAPVDVVRGAVFPYPRALCLKPPLPTSNALPAGTPAIGARLHVPVESLGMRFHREPLPLGAIFFLRRSPRSGMTCRRVTRAAGVAHLIANALNAAAHPANGLATALMLSQRFPCYELDCTHLNRARRAVKRALSRSLLHGANR